MRDYSKDRMTILSESSGAATLLRMPELCESRERPDFQSGRIAPRSTSISLTRGGNFGHIARIVNDGAVQVLAFDYDETSSARHQHLDPWQQISDYRNALSYAESRDDVDPVRLGSLEILQRRSCPNFGCY